MVDDLLSNVVEEYPQFASEVVVFGGAFIAVGLLIALLIWTVGVVIRAAFGWLSRWTETR